MVSFILENEVPVGRTKSLGTDTIQYLCLCHGYLRGIPCTTHINRREIFVVYATGYNADIRGIRHKYYIRGIRARGYPQISVVYDPRILARNLAHSP